MVQDDPVISAFKRAAEDRRHGAAEIESSLLEGLMAVRGHWTRHGLSEGAALLLRGQPAMASLAAFAARAKRQQPGELEAWIRLRLSIRRDIEDELAIGSLPWIAETARVITISRSSAVAAVVKGAWLRGWDGEVVVLEGTSAGRGDEQARDLETHGRALSLPDSEAPPWLDPAGAVVVVGADAIGPHRFINCNGTRALLEAAAERGVARLLVADRSKNVDDEAISAMLGAVPMHRAEDGRQWPLFEEIPLDLVTARISE